MPELPEVDTVRRRLEPVLAGRRFDRVEILDARLTRPHDPLGVAAELTGERIRAVDRRGKYLVLRFESGRALLIHLRMTGSLLHVPAGTAAGADPYRRATVGLDDGSQVVYRDVRRFGTWLLAEPDEVEPYLDARLGREPLAQAFTTRRLADALQGRRAPVKAAILDQRRLAGVGNIYADEALWRARVHPLRSAGELAEHELRALHRGIRAALNAGIARQGATLRDYRTPDGRSGRMQHEFKVYGREGEPCERCGRPIEKIRAAGRGTWFCPHCQRLDGMANDV
ncbi:MAG TPA: bifunctional DNA-formamidopyrimidine glycosylase/DNA-(apurinic or apyrimidinic site) lyase [Gaiellaceae bacterium]|nr:bifunctional DNA-formamidopyrimidine glycosylase/DNA-(apurinic or apyrimidinic site) lyase [Gaiellaceae bacterium]